jgi:hypothetical protein
MVLVVSQLGAIIIAVGLGVIILGMIIYGIVKLGKKK